MSKIHVPRAWDLPESQVTPEQIYRDRRRFLAAVGAGAGALLAGGLLACSGGGARPADAGGGDGGGGDVGADGPRDWTGMHADLYPAARNERYGVEERPLTAEELAKSYNNYYEFTVSKTGVKELAAGFVTYPWTVEIAGLVPQPQLYDLDSLVRTMTLEERIYRFRCVETWAMTVPWTGFPLRRLIEAVNPLSSARYVRFVTVERASQMPAVKAKLFDWPYEEGLRMDEAMNEMTLLATGIYGAPLPPQSGAPLRLVISWQYGYKSIKSIVRIEFVAEQPATFWSSIAPHEYPFTSNVDPEVPHPRWSQATEQLLGESERIPTLKYNGYGDLVASLYE